MGWKGTALRALRFVGYYGVGLAFLLLGVAVRSPALVIGVFVAFAIGGFVVRRRLIDRGEVPDRAPLYGIGFGLIGLGLLAIVIAWTTEWSGRTYALVGGLGLVFVTAGQMMTDLRARPSRPHDLRTPALFLTALAGVFLVGVVWLWARPGPWALVPLLVAVLLAPTAVGLATGRVLRILLDSTWQRLALLGSAGAVVLLIGVSVLAGVGMRGSWLTLLVVVTVLLVGAVASNTDLDVIGVAALVALVASLAPQGVSPDAAITPQDGDRVVVAIGDSYMSGEGARQFYEGTNSVGANQCRRAPTAYPPLLAERTELIDSVVFVACSGAQSVHRADEDGDGRTDGDADRQRQLPEAEAILAAHPVTIDTVLISMGGNDSAFSEVAATCLAPGDCTEIAQRWLDDLPNTAARLRAFYADVAEAFPDVPIVVIPYPIPITPEGCGNSGFSDQEHRFLVAFTEELDDVVRQEAGAAGFHYLGTIERLFERNDLRICDSRDAAEVGVNFLTRDPADGFTADRLNPANWVHNSLHPNRLGHQAIFQALEPYFETEGRRPWPLVDPDATWTPRTLADILGADATFCGGSRAPDYCPASPTDWAIVQSGLALARAALPLLFLAVGAWMLWLVLLSLRFHVSIARRLRDPDT